MTSGTPSAAPGGARARGAPPEPHDAPAAPAGHHRTPAPRRERARGLPERLGGFAVLALVAAPALWLAARTVAGDLGSDPIETLEHYTGHWTLRFLALTLLVSPLRRLLGWSWLARHRRTLGLATFAYATLHLLVYTVLDMQLVPADIVEDVLEHPYVTVGMATWLLLLPLAVTSTKGWMRRLGGRRWNALHRLVYLAAIGGTVHYLWAVKKDVRDPLLYLAVFVALLGWRVWVRMGRRVA